MTGSDAVSLDGISLLLVWAATGTCLLAFIASAITRPQRSPAAIAAPARVPALAGRATPAESATVAALISLGAAAALIVLGLVQRAMSCPSLPPTATTTRTPR